MSYETARSVRRVQSLSPPARARTQTRISFPIERAYKKIFRTPRASRDRLQLLVAARVRRIVLHSAFSRGKNLSIFVFKVYFEIFYRDITLYFSSICATRVRGKGDLVVSPCGIIIYRTKSLQNGSTIEGYTFWMPMESRMMCLD
jgi:hypothetical protein